MYLQTKMKFLHQGCHKLRVRTGQSHTNRCDGMHYHATFLGGNNCLTTVSDRILMLLGWLTVNRKCKTLWKNMHRLSEIQSSCSLWIPHRRPTRRNTKWKVQRPCGRRYTLIQNSTS